MHMFAHLNTTRSHFTSPLCLSLITTYSDTSLINENLFRLICIMAFAFTDISPEYLLLA